MQVMIEFIVRGKKTITKNLLRELLNYKKLLHAHVLQVGLMLDSHMLGECLMTVLSSLCLLI